MSCGRSMVKPEGLFLLVVAAQRNKLLEIQPPELVPCTQPVICRGTLAHGMFNCKVTRPPDAPLCRIVSVAQPDLLKAPERG